MKLEYNFKDGDYLVIRNGGRGINPRDKGMIVRCVVIAPPPCDTRFNYTCYFEYLQLPNYHYITRDYNEKYAVACKTSFELATLEDFELQNIDYTKLTFWEAYEIKCIEAKIKDEIGL